MCNETQKDATNIKKIIIKAALILNAINYYYYLTRDCPEFRSVCYLNTGYRETYFGMIFSMNLTTSIAL